MIKAKDIYDYIDSIAPFDTQMEGDNAGFLVGDKDKEVTAILLTLDVTGESIKEAKEKGASLILSHHPVIFHPLRALESGSVPYLLAKNDVAVISAHTNLDLAQGGVGDCLASVLMLQNVRKAGDCPAFIRVGELEKPLSREEFLDYVSQKLSCGGIKYTIGADVVKTVAICGGSGGAEWKYAKMAGADAYVTANVKHNDLVDANMQNFFILDAGHFRTENVVIAPLAERLKKAFPKLSVYISERVSDPASYFVKR